jgi:hypothetical protein
MLLSVIYAFPKVLGVGATHPSSASVMTPKTFPVNKNDACVTYRERASGIARDGSLNPLAPAQA